MLRAIAAQAGAAVQARIRDAVARAVLLLVALVFLLGAIAFGSVALYLYLLTVTGPVIAALGVAGLFLLAMLLALVMAMAGSRRAPAAAPSVAAGPGAGAPPPPGGPAAAPGVAGLTGDAEALGVLLGRNLGGVPLVLTALAIGLMLGRIRK